MKGERTLKRKNKIYQRKFDIFCLILEGLASLLLMFLVLRLNALPKKYEAIVGAVLLLLFLLLGAVIFRVRKKSGRIITRIVNVLLIIVLFVGSFFVYKGDDVLRAISGANKKTYTMSLIVLDESSLEKIDDLSGRTVAINTAGDTENINIAMEALKNDVADIDFEVVESYKELVKALYEGNVEAILVNEAYRSMLEVEDDDFDSKTRVLWSHDITLEMTNVSKSVDVTNTPFTIYISGIDAYGSISTVSRTDVNMLVTVNPNTKQILMTSIPRDTWVELADMQAYDKLTHSGIGGVENSVATLENFFNIDINYYARVNFSSVVSLVDAIGGIDVESKYEFSMRKGDQYIEIGMNHLDGVNALAFARERHAFDYMFSDSEQGDQIRVENQQAVLEGMIKKLTSPAIITKYNGILNAMQGMFDTSLSSSEITDLIAMQLDDMSGWDFVNQKVTGHYEYRYGGAHMPDWELVYYIPDESSVASCVDKINDILNNKRISE